MQAIDPKCNKKGHPVGCPFVIRVQKRTGQKTEKYLVFN
jgi:hypothetical protein